jgi:uncharacterized protein YwgA
MSNQNYPKFYRQRFILTLLRQADGCLSKMDFQKLLFLSHKKTGVRYYDFVPYHYGCYSFQAASDLETLHCLGWLELKKNDIKLLHNLPFDKGLKASETEKIIRFMRGYQGYGSRKLVRSVYEQYPYYAVKSKMARDVLSKEGFERIEKERRHISSQESVLFTIGYEGISFEECVNMLVRNDIRLLCDVRKNALSRKFGFSKGTLSSLLPKLGIKYLHVPELGIVSDKRKQLKTEDDYRRLFDEYRKTISQKETYLQDLVTLLESNKRIVLTCFEKIPTSCHRHCISDYLAAQQGVRVVHL